MTIQCNVVMMSLIFQRPYTAALGSRIFKFCTNFRFSYFVSILPQMRHVLTHWGRMTHNCVSILTIIGSDNGLSPGRRHAIIWTNDGILLIGPLVTKIQWNLNRNLHIFIQENAFENVVWIMTSFSSRPQCVKFRDGINRQRNCQHPAIVLVWNLRVGNEVKQQFSAESWSMEWSIRTIDSDIPSRRLVTLTAENHTGNIQDICP